jgi:signal transduction histidine kinase
VTAALSSLRAKALLLVGATFLALLGIAAFFAAVEREAGIQRATERVAEIAARITAREQRAVIFAREIADLLAGTRNVLEFAGSGECRQMFARILGQEPRLSNIVITDGEGRILCSGEASGAGVYAGDRDYFQRALAAPEFVMEEPIRGRASGRYAIPYAKALRDASGRPRAVFREARLPMGARLTVLNARGTVLTRYPDPDGWIGRDASGTEFFRVLNSRHGVGAAFAPGFDGVQRVYGFSKFAETTSGPIWLSAGVDRDAVTADANEEFFATLLVIAALFSIAFLAIWFGGARLLRPLAAMSEVARGLASGNYALRTGVRYSADEIGSLARSFDSMAAAMETRTQQLMTANTELEAFAYSVSHDLRTPLRSIDGFSQAILEDYRDRLDDTGKNYLERLRAASQHMGRLIDDILRLSRISRGEMKVEEVSLSALVEALLPAIRASRPGAAQFRVAPGLRARCDPRLMTIALENLLSNAWKFSARTLEACIEFGSRDDNGEQVYFVRDNGAGFDMQYAGHLFAPFQRLHRPDEFPGTGIGLATVKRVISRHGGRVWAEGAPGKGATFYFTLPEKGTP